MFTQALNVDIATISKSAKGRVLFFDADGVCVLGLSETAQIQMQFDSGFLYVIQDGGGTGLFSQGSVTNVPMEFNCSFYKFTLMGLTDIDGRPFTAMPTVDFNQEDYLAKAREAYEYLVTNIFVGCCNTGVDSILWYADEASFPATGLTDTLYVDKATPALFIWDGTAYVAIAGGSGGGVASVTGYSVDNTDPLNPIVKAIPIAGTDAAEPVTGNIEVTGGVEMFVENSARASILWDDGSVEIRARDLALTTTTAIFVNDGGVLVASDVPSFAGVVYNADYSTHFNNLSLINQLVMKSRIWTKAGTPDVNDDVNDGYVVGSLIWDTTNSILYKCTDNTGGAAVWAYATVQSEIIRAGATIPTLATRWMVAGLSGMGTSAVVNMVEKAIHTDFRIYLGGAQPATGSLTITREITSLTGTVLQTDVLTVAAGSAIGEYVFNTASYNALTTAVAMKFILLNNAASSSGFVQGLERFYTR